MQEVCDLLDVTRTAVRQRLARLENDGLILKGSSLQARGRPRNTYAITGDGLDALGENYRDVAVAMWEAVSQLPDPSVREAIQSAFLTRFAKRLALRIETDGGEQLEALATGLQAAGLEAEVDRSGELPILREAVCPFPHLADVDESICEMERQAFETILDADVSFRNRCRDGHSCCEFEISRRPQTADVG